MAFQALVVSGDESLVQRFSATLSEFGIQAECVSETDSALVLLGSHDFDAVLLDCDVEGGLRLAESLRQEFSQQHALVIAFVSGIDDAKAASKVGANFILYKPINWEVAKRTLRAAHTLIIRERRRSIREKVRVPAKVSFDNKIIDVVIVDLSDGGLAARSTAMLAAGTSVAIHLTLPGSKDPIKCNGTVAWANRDLAGIRFSSVAPSSARVLVKWLDGHSPRRGKIASAAFN